MASKPTLRNVNANSSAEPEATSIKKPADKPSLNKFKSKKAAALTNIETLPTELKIHKGVETYKVDYARNQDAFPEPKWSTAQTLDDLILTRFSGLIIEAADHPGLLRMIGAKQANS